MAYTNLIMERPTSGDLKTAPVGFSWTTFFFSFFVPLLRGNFKWFLIQFVLYLGTLGISTWVFMFIYNKLYVKGLIGKGYKVLSVDSDDLSEVSGLLEIDLTRYLSPGYKVPALQSENVAEAPAPQPTLPEDSGTGINDLASAKAPPPSSS